jgi:protein-disulfide isomerase
LDNTLARLRSKYDAVLAVSYRQFPIAQLHPFARSAALASECANAQGRFDSYSTVLFAHQDSIGKIAWSSLASRAGITDTVSFARCLRDSTFASRITADSVEGVHLKVRGTPTVMVNGWRLNEPPTEAKLDSLIRKEMTKAGKGK